MKQNDFSLKNSDYSIFAKMGKKIIALCGTIGSGKTTAADFLRQKGYPVIDCDDLARKAAEDRDIKEQILINFGKEYVIEGEIQRRKLAQKAFGNKAETEILNSIFHQRILKLLIEKILNIKDDIIFVELQVLNKPFADLFEEIWIIKTTAQNAIKRVTARDGRTPQQVEDILNTQNMQNKQFNSKSRIINNDGTIKELYMQIDRILKQILQI